MTIYYNIDLIVIILLGMAMGSFMTMASYRLSVRDKKYLDLLFSPSSCPKCSNRLRMSNMVPIFSWIFQEGKCSFCKSPIPARYPIIEFASTLSFIIIYFALDRNIDAKMILALLIFSVLFLMIITDLEHYFISDVNQIIFFILIAIYHFLITFNQNNFDYSIWYYIYSGFLYLFFGIALHYIFKLATKRDGIGVDDIKFFAIAGFSLGIDQFAIFMFLSGFLGIIFGVIWQKVKNDDSFPFAPALIVAWVITFVVNFEKWRLFY